MRLIDTDTLKYRRKEYDGHADVSDKQREEGIMFLLKEDIDNAPAVDHVKHGKWIFENRTWFHQPLLKCSCCGRRQFLARFDYCPYCGARMNL